VANQDKISYLKSAFLNVGLGMRRSGEKREFTYKAFEKGLIEGWRIEKWIAQLLLSSRTISQE
jgi:hypothetical protein